MSRHLSLLLEAKEPQFHHTLKRLEVASGYSNNDIRMSEAINNSVRDKLKLLNLDPDDTTGEELYHALAEKLKSDESSLIKELRKLSATYVSAEGNLSQGIAYAVQDTAKGYKCYGVKSTIIKKHISKFPPKRTMKVLGYRSIPSMLKHEPLPLVMAIAFEYEPSTWVKQYRTMLRSLKSSDCEEKKFTVHNSHGVKWDKLSLLLISDTKRTVLVNNELAALIVLSLPSNEPSAGLTTATLALAAEGVNSILSSSSYLKLSQVTNNFGQRLEKAIYGEPEIGISIITEPLSWETVQRFFHHLTNSIGEIFDDHIDIEEIARWQPVEQFISRISPAMSYWQNTGYLGYLDNNKPISFNIVDNALNLCNHRDYKNRLYHHAQRNLWQEFILRYIRPELVKEAINNELQPKLAAEFVSAN